MRGGGVEIRKCLFPGGGGGVEISKFLFPGGGGVEISTAFTFLTDKHNYDFKSAELGQ